MKTVNKTFDRKDISAVEARGLVAGVCWDDFINTKIQQCNNVIRHCASIGHREAHVDIWCKEKYVWERVIEHFQDKGFEVKREWFGIVLRW